MTPRVMTVKVLRGLKLNKIASTMYYRHLHGFASAGHELPVVVRRCMETAQALGTADGDYLEFGIFKGHTFLSAQQAAVDLGLDRMRFFGFDSFQGLPEPRGLDRAGNQAFYEGQYACSIDYVREQLTEGGIDWETAALIPGFFDETLVEQTRNDHDLRKLSVALVDCDLYESTVDALAFLEPMLREGSILIMDDWGALGANPRLGQQRALNEFFEEYPQWGATEWSRYGSYGRVFVVRSVRAMDFVGAT